MSEDFRDRGRKPYLLSSRQTFGELKSFGEGKPSKFQLQSSNRYQRDSKFVTNGTSKNNWKEHQEKAGTQKQKPKPWQQKKKAKAEKKKN